MLPWLLCVILLIVVLALGVKVRLLQRSMDEIAGELADRLATDTNILLSLSTRDRHARRLAADLNRQLRLLRAQRRRYLNGDRELKEAVTNISHDLRTPLTAIQGYLDLLDRESKPEAVERYLSFIQNRVNAMTQLTEELFRYSMILSAEGDLRSETVDVKAVLEESVAGLYGALKERGIEPQITLPSGSVPCRLDRAALSRVFGNILSNALKYSSGDLEITLSQNGEVSFANTAPGLDQVQVERLFDRFFTVETARSSTGLGLAIVKSLTERMNGTIAARYEGGRLCIKICFQCDVL